MTVFETGLLGEYRAARYLRGQGMRILKRRYRAPGGEIDLIARDGETLVFVEVKYRPKGHIGDGIKAIDREKLRCLRRAAEGYLSRHPCGNTRFDAVEITAAGIRHWKNVC